MVSVRCHQVTEVISRPRDCISTLQVQQVFAFDYISPYLLKNNTYYDICLESFEWLGHRIQLAVSISDPSCFSTQWSHGGLYPQYNQIIIRGGGVYNTQQIQCASFCICFAFRRYASPFEDKHRLRQRTQSKGGWLAGSLAVVLSVFPKYFIFQNVQSPCNCHPRSFSSPQTGESVSLKHWEKHQLSCKRETQCLTLPQLRWQIQQKQGITLKHF